MPKVSQKTKTVEVVEPPKEEKRAPVFRLFECLVHLEQAKQHLAKVGIIPSSIEGVSPLMISAKLEEAARHVDQLVQTYNKAWVAEQFGGTK